MQAFLDALSRSPRLLWTLIAISGGVLVILFYYVVGLGRDDLYETRMIDDRLAYTLPVTTHASSKEYRLFIHTSEVLGIAVTAIGSTVTPPVTVTNVSSSSTPAITATSGTGSIATTGTLTVTVIGAAGVMLLPDQSLSFTFTPGLYQSFPIAYVNNHSDSSEIGVQSATITLATSSGEEIIYVPREQGWQTLVRRLVSDFLNITVLTALFPALLGLIGGLFALNQRRRNRQLAEVKGYVEKIINGTDKGSDLESKIDLALPKLLKARQGMKDEEQDQLQQVEIKYNLYYQLIKALRNQRLDLVDPLVIQINNSATILGEKDRLLIKFSTELDVYRKHQLEPKKYPLTLSINTPFINERLTYLEHLGLLDQIDLEDIKALLELHVANQNLDQRFAEHLRKRLQATEISLPPDYIEDKEVYAQPLKLWLPPILPLDLNLYLTLEPKNEIILVTGVPGSGKTTTLGLLQRAKRRAGALYLQPLAAAQLANDSLSTIREAILSALLALLTEKPTLWTYLSERPQSNRTAAQQSLDIGGQGGDLLALAVLSDQMAALRLDTLCIAVDDAPSDFDYPLVHQQIQVHVRQKVFFRVALLEPPAYRMTYPCIHLDWSRETLGDLLEMIRVEGGQSWSPGWTPAVSPELLLDLVKTPQDLLAWVVALQMCYDGNDLSKQDWQILRSEMERAREKRCPGATDWQLADVEAARRVLRSQ